MSSESEKKADKICSIAMGVMLILIGIVALTMSAACAYSALFESANYVLTIFLWIYSFLFLVLGIIVLFGLGPIVIEDIKDYFRS